MVLFYSYAGSLFVGLPIAFYLFTKNKCSYTALAISGFTLGFLALIITKQELNHGFSTAQLIPTITFASWYGFSAAVGAALFGYISGVSPWYNKSSKPTTKSVWSLPTTQTLCVKNRNKYASV